MPEIHSSPNSAPVTNGGTVATISFSHLSATTKIILWLCLILGGGGGGWHLLGQAQQAVVPDNQTSAIKERLGHLEIGGADARAVITKLIQTDKDLIDALNKLEVRLDILMQITAANYAATTAGSPSRRRAAASAASKIRDNTLLLKSDDPDPLRILEGLNP